MKQYDIYTRVTEDIISILENGELPPWAYTWQSGMNQNFVSRKPYRGINQFALEARAMKNAFTSSYWLTFRQCKQAGGYVKKEERSTIVIKWLWFQESDTNGDVIPDGKKWATQKYFNVFNTDQCEGIEVSHVETNIIVPFDQCETLVAEMPVKPIIVHEDRTRAYYSPLQDRVNVPALQYFESSETYYSTLFMN